MKRFAKDSILGLALAALLALPLLAACESDGGGEEGTTTWECDAAHDDWELCTDGVVQWCHVLEGMEPHFHNGANCAALGLECVELTAGDAACVDMDSSCTEGDSYCGAEGTEDENTAFTCVDGHLAVEPCGTAYHCHEEDGAAVCELEGEDECGGHGHLHDGVCECEDGYTIDPDDETNCVADGEEPSFPEASCTLFQDDEALESKAVVTTFAGVFAADYHADLEVPVEVTLPDNEVSYIHFPCLEDGEYVIFLSHAEVLEAVLDRNENELVLGGGVANGMCSEVIPDHYHADLTYDGDGEGPVPFVLRFAAVPSETVRFLVRIHEEDHDHEEEE